MKLDAGNDRTKHRLDDRADHPGRRRRRPGRDRSALFPEVDDGAGDRRQAVSAAAARRARRLPARRLLQLPLADDSPVPRRDRALRPLLGRRRVRLRPSVPVGQQAHRTRPGARRWRAIPTTGIACTSTIRATSCRSRTCRGIRGSRRRRSCPRRSSRRCARCARSACPTPTKRSRRRPDELKGKTEEDAVVAYLQNLGLVLRNVK